MERMVLPPLAIPAYDQEWRRRWIYMPPTFRVLHRIAVDHTDSWDADDWNHSGRGTIADTVCGIERREVYMPGIFSRIGLPRCKKCCRKLGIPNGAGAPYNDRELQPEYKGA